MAKTIVKHWCGTSSDSSKADFQTFNTKKEAKSHVQSMLRFHAINGGQMSGCADYYEILPAELTWVYQVTLWNEGGTAMLENKQVKVKRALRGNADAYMERMYPYPYFFELHNKKKL